ncbi:MAG: M20/M25/M40 family metallo-hydrolase [Phycisphaerales bacterium]|nr:M20/M25/M40 family metallo-hydrolase [Phycisphaerales bacterium]
MRKRTLAGVMAVCGGVAVGVVVGECLAGPVEDVSAERVMEGLRALPVARAPLGDAEHRKGLRATEELLVERLKGMGYEPVVQKIEWVSPAQRLGRKSEVGKDGAEKKEADGGGDGGGGGGGDGGKDAAQPGDPPEFWNNIIVDLPGKELAEEVLLIGAHFDAVAKSPGADDNGSGTAALLEVARVLKDHPMKRTVRLVFFNLEEIGLVGSRQYAANFAANKESKERIVGMVSLEMIGYFCMEEGCQRSPVGPIKGVFEPPTKGDTLAAVTLAAHQEFNKKFTAAFEAGSDGLKITRFDFMPMPIPDVMRSDHAPFLAQGVPAIMLTDTSNFRNPNYHKPTDAVETLDQDRYVRGVRGVVSAVIGLADEGTGEQSAGSK